MEGEYLHAMEISPITQKVKDNETGEMVERTLSIEEQVNNLSPEWKPVDDIDESRQDTDRENYVIRILPYDAGDRISFKYIEVPDLQKLKREIERLKEQLGSSDYKVIKSYEANLLGDSMPYDIKALHDERQSLRDRINALESDLASLSELMP